MNKIIYFLLLFCCSCSNADRTESNLKSIVENKNSPLKETYVLLDKLSITGDFDGDGTTDTLYQNNISGITKLPIDSFPDSQWDSIENYFSKIDADVILTLSNQKHDTLHLGSGASLYCLINIGDNNKDKKDEIAFVVNRYNFTNISRCYIYTLCDPKWIELKSFNIHEFAFQDEDDSLKSLKQIKGFLEYRKNKWFFISYDDWFNAESNKDTILKVLKIKKGC